MKGGVGEGGIRGGKEFGGRIIRRELGMDFGGALSIAERE
jgi:hypothetical protein